MGERIILIGFMGAGKTSVGQAIAGITGAPFLDTDQMIEAAAGKSISRIFEEDGEEAFRRTETEVITGLLSGSGDAVISTGGGLPMREENRQALRKMGRVVYLKVRPETVLERLKGDTTRPLLAGGDAAARVRKLLEFRDPVYRQAAHEIVDADGRTPGEIAGQIAGKHIFP